MTRLYHFSDISILSPEEQPDGQYATTVPDRLIARVADDEEEMPPAVWLTTNPDPGLHNGPLAGCVRITLTIPSTDRKLISNRDWTRRRYGISQYEIDDFIGQVRPSKETPWVNEQHTKDAFDHWFAYRGDIPQARFTAVEFLENQQPWWKQCSTCDGPSHPGECGVAK
jgi:hypothetical protein